MTFNQSNRGPPPDLRKNKIVIAIVFGLVAVGAVWYGLNTYILHPTPTVHAVAPVSQPTGPGTPGHL